MRHNCVMMVSYLFPNYSNISTVKVVHSSRTALYQQSSIFKLFRGKKFGQTLTDFQNNVTY